MRTLLQEFGLTEKEATIFLKLLELGAQPVSVIAKQVGMPRTSIYFTIESLKRHKLIEEFRRANTKYVKCIPVDNLLDVLKDKEREIEKTMKMLQEKLPQLHAIESTLSITPKLQFFEGKQEVMDMYKKVLEEESFCAFLDPRSMKKLMPEYHFQIPAELKKKGGRAKELLVDSKEAQEYLDQFSSLSHEIKILPKKIDFESDIIICKDRLYLTAYGEKQIAGTELFSPSLSQTQQMIFDSVWESTP